MWHNAPFIQKMKERLKDGTPLLREQHEITLVQSLHSDSTFVHPLSYTVVYINQCHNVIRFINSFKSAKYV